MIAPPSLNGALAEVADAVSSWPRVIVTGHWILNMPRQVDGIDFYVGDEELGHIRLDGDLHLATSPSLGKDLVTRHLAQPFP